MSDRSPARVPALSLLASILFLPSFLQAQLPSTLYVVNPLPQTRTLEPVSVGFPVSKQFPVTDASTLVLRDAGQQLVPCQFKVLSRWGADRAVATAPLKWVLATFRPTLPGNATVTFSVDAGGPPAPSGGLTTTTAASAITVTPYAGTSFVVPTTAFGPFSQVTIGGQNVVTSAGGIQMTDPSGAAIVPVITSPTVIEDGGTTRTVLRQKGSLGSLKYTTRWYFHAGRNDVAIDFRLENSAAYGLISASVPDGQAYFDLLSINQPIAGSPLTVTSSLASHSIPAGQDYELTQDFGTAVPYDLLSGFNCVTRVNGAQVGSTGTYPGALDVTGPSGGATITVERFWQNFPKSLRVKSGEARIGLFPEWGNGPEYKGQYADPTSTAPVDPMALTNYRFEGGRWKTFHLVYDFHGPGARTVAQVATEAQRVNTPLVGHPETSLARTTFATGNLLIERTKPPAYTSITRYNHFFDMMVDDNAATNVPNLGKIGLPQFINRGGTWGDRQCFGWENYGDLPWADGYCDLHYNWPASLLLEFLRTGDWRFFDRGRDMAEFRRDYGQNHGTNTAEAWRGCQFYEKGWWHGNFVEGDHGHNWALGTLLHYALTGDEGSREAALENADFCIRNTPATWTGWWGSRIPGRAIEALVDAYNFLGNPAYLVQAGLGVGRFESFEVADGSHGYHLNPANAHTSVWMDNVFYTAAAKYVLASNDSSHLPFLGRMRTWFKTTCIIMPTGPSTASTMPIVYDSWAPGFEAGNTLSVHHDWEMVEALTYSAVIQADMTDLATAAWLFEGIVRYWQTGASTTAVYDGMNSNSFSAITMRPMQYPNSESKVLGNILNSGAPHVALRSWYAGNW